MDPETTFRSLTTMEAAPAAAAAGGAPVAATRATPRAAVLTPEVQDPWLIGFVQAALALTALLLLSPVMLVVAILVRATSPGRALRGGASTPPGPGSFRGVRRPQLGRFGNHSSPD